MKAPYRTAIDDDGCPKCGHGATWTVVDADGDVAIGSSFDKPQDADKVAAAMNAVAANEGTKA